MKAVEHLGQFGRFVLRTPLLIAAFTAVIVLGGGIFVFASSNGGTPTATEVFLEPADSLGANPFIDLLRTPVPTVVLARDLLPDNVKDGTASLSGGTVGIYGGTLNNSECDREQLITFLTQNPPQARAWASVQNITTEQIPSYIRSLTPVQLRLDTRVTNHGYENGAATPLQSVLQAGTAVLVDRNGVPRARCACGNPLLPPQPASNPTYTGAGWDEFDDDKVVRVTPNNTDIKTFILHDAQTGKLFNRPTGTTGDQDTPYTAPLAKTTPRTGNPSPPSPTTGTTGSTVPGASTTSTSTSGSTSSTDQGSGSTTEPTVAPPPKPTVPPTNPPPTQPPPTEPPPTQPPPTEPPPPTQPPPQTVAVPGVVGLSEPEARRLVEGAGLTMTVTTVEDGRNAGKIVAQDPGAQAQVPKGSNVAITLAVAPKTVAVPPFGPSIQDARKQAGAVGLKLVEDPRRAITNCDEVVSQSRKPGEQVPPGTEVTVVYRSCLRLN